jgi:hypothetical protein
LVADLDLPIRGTLQDLPLFCAEYPNLKIILLSGYLSNDTQQSNQIRGPLVVLPKPFPMEFLLENVRTLLMKVICARNVPVTASSEENGRYKELADRIQRKGPVKAGPAQRLDKRKKA